MKRFATLGVALLLLLGIAATASAEGEETATSTFNGVASTGAGQPMPVDTNPADIAVRGDGAVGFGYVYRADGKATGQLSGDFVYEERGYLYFTNPADPATFAGRQFVSGVFTLSPNGTSAPVTIADTNPQGYTYGTAILDSGSARGALGRANSLLRQGGDFPKDGELTYGYFTFTNEHGTFTGYSTPDSRKFMITIEYDR
ncbi:MAG: hypothetical protein ACYC66_11535 [Chloroflexota bacterium]